MSCSCKVCHCFSSQTTDSLSNADNSINGTLNKVNSLINNNNTNKSNMDHCWSSSSVQKYPFNIDLVPKVIRKKSKCTECNQDVTIKYLEANKTTSTLTPTTINTSSSTPIIINQTYSKTPSTTPSIIIRQIPYHHQQQHHYIHNNTPINSNNKTSPVPYETVITIPGELLSPPPLKVVIEILPEVIQPPPQLHQPPNNAEIVERYLEYQDMNRQMISNSKQQQSDDQSKNKNLILNWDKRDCTEIKTNIKNLGVVSADPKEYAQKYGPSLVSAPELPEIAARAKNEHGYLLAADFKTNYFNSLEGDVHALGMIDLDKEGLSEYKYLIQDPLKNKLES